MVNYYFKIKFFIFDHFLILLLLFYSHIANKKIFIIGTPYGRWGNRLMLYSYIISWSKKFNGIVLNPSFIEYEEYFKNFKSNVFGLIPCKAPPKNKIPKFFSKMINESFNRIAYRKIKIPRIISFDLESENEDYEKKSFQTLLRRSKVVFFRGFLFGKRNFKSVGNLRNYLKNLFEFSDKIVSRSNEILGSINKSYIIGVCMRQGDYKNHFNGKLFLEDHEYKMLLDRLKIHFGNDFGIFVACEEKKDEILDESAYFNYGEPAVNLCTLSKCNYLIGPASTFMTWAAFLNNVPTCYIDRDNFKTKELRFIETTF